MVVTKLTDDPTEEAPLVTSGPPSTVPEKQVSNVRLAVVCASLYFGVFVASLDGTVVASLLSHIASDLNELGRISWIATGYLVACAAFQPLYGKLSDIFGRKRVLIFCNVSFGVGCLICGISRDLKTLVAGRVVSGIGGGGMLSMSTIVLSDLIPLRRRGIFQGIGNICYGLGAGVGGIFGGIISDRYGWRTAFNCQVPAVALSTFLVTLFTPSSGPPSDDDEDLVPAQEAEAVDEAVTEREQLDEQNCVSSGDQYGTIQNQAHHNVHYVKRAALSRVDIWGSTTLVSFLVFLMFAIATGGRQYPWTHPFVLSSFGFAAIFAGLFVYVETHIAKEPVLPMPLFTHRTILASSLTNMFMTMSVYSIIFFVPVALSSVLDMTPTQVGQRLTANFVGVAVGSFSAGVYMKQTGKYYYLGVLSPTLFFAGALMICRVDLMGHGMYPYVAMFLPGAGYSAMLTVTLLALIAAVPHDFQAVTTSIQYAFRGIGSTLGVSIASSIFQNVLARRLYESVTGPDADQVIRRVLDSVEAIRHVPVEYQPAIIDSYASASVAVFYTALALAVVSTFTSSLMGEHQLHNTLSRE
jgi:MFS family permease